MKIKSIEKFKNVLDNIVINEEQKTALHEFFSEFSNILREKIREEVILENEKTETTVDTSEFEVLFEEKLIVAKKQWEEEKALEINALKETLQEEYAEELTSALEELYESVEVKVKADLSKTKEFAALETIKEAILPLINNEDTQAIAKEVGELRKEKAVLESFINDTRRENIIEDLVADFSEKKAAVIKEFLAECTDEEEIYKAFNRVVSIFEMQEEEEVEEFNEEDEEEDLEEDLEILGEEEENEEEEESDEEEEEEEDESFEIEDEELEEELAEEQTKTPIVDIKTKRDEKLQMFSEAEQAILKKAQIF